MKRKLTANTAYITVVLYVLFSIVAGILAVILFGGVTEASADQRLIDDLIDSGMYGTMLVAIVLILAGIFVFSDSTKDIFLERTSHHFSAWYYVYPLVLLGVTLFALANVDYSSYSANVILRVLIATLAIGIGEEIITRGILLGGLRNSRVDEWKVWVITLIIFSLLHAVNLLAGSNMTQLIVVLTTGSIWYISRRIFGNLLIPIAAA